MTSQRSYTHETWLFNQTCTSTVTHIIPWFTKLMYSDCKYKLKTKSKTLNPVKSGARIKMQKTSKHLFAHFMFWKHHSHHLFNKTCLNVGVVEHLENSLAVVPNLSLHSSFNTNIIKAFCSTHKLFTIDSTSSKECKIDYSV